MNLPLSIVNGSDSESMCMKSLRILEQSSWTKSENSMAFLFVQNSCFWIIFGVGFHDLLYNGCSILWMPYHSCHVIGIQLIVGKYSALLMYRDALVW